MPHLEAKADRLKAGGLNLVMESQEISAIGDQQLACDAVGCWRCKKMDQFGNLFGVE